MDEYEKNNPDATFEEVSERFLENRDGEIIIHVISPRCFEAAALKTLMIMYEGDYSGVLIKGKHYLALKRDHSNMNEIVDVISDPKRAKKIIEAAYSEVACSGKWTFRTFIQKFDSVVEEELVKQNIQLYSQTERDKLFEVENKINVYSKRFSIYYKFERFCIVAAMFLYKLIEKVLPRSVKGPVINSLRFSYFFNWKDFIFFLKVKILVKM